jgi:predicted dehydrogenase
MKRREFLKRTAQTAAVLSSASAFSAPRVRGANDRVNVGLIGCGGRGKLVARLMREVPNVDFTAVCDVYAPRAAEARAWAGPRAREFGDFRRVLEMKEVDAVVIATPDHWHGIPAVLACEAGKDVFVEKPLAYSIREGRKVVEAARKNRCVMQVGTQQRSAPHYQEARRIIQSGALGEIRFARIWNYVNMHPAGIGVAADSEPPEGADWDFFLGPAPKVPFNKNRFVSTYRWFWDYGGGMVSDFGVHRFDSMHQLMGVDSPVSASAAGGRFELKDGGETPDFIQVTYEYPGFVLSYEASMINAFGTGPRAPERQAYYQAKGERDHPHGEAFYGTNGTLFSNRIGFEIFPELDIASGPGAAGDRTAIKGLRMERKEATGTDRTDLHVRDFIECVRTREEPVAGAEIGHRSSNVAHLGNISYRVGRKIRWDGEKEEIVGDAEAAKLLWREPRKEWDVI